MKQQVRTAYRQALSEAKAAPTPDVAFAALERAHILGQRDLFAHFETHILMLTWALQQKDTRELRGQAMRLAAVLPGFVLGWVPVGNPGGANISALKPVPLPADLAQILGKIDLRIDIAIRVVLAALAFLGWFILNRGN